MESRKSVCISQKIPDNYHSLKTGTKGKGEIQRGFPVV